jgi:hypothetical protein
MKSLGGNGIFNRDVWFEQRDVRVSVPNLKATPGKTNSRAIAKI